MDIENQPTTDRSQAMQLIVHSHADDTLDIISTQNNKVILAANQGPTISKTSILRPTQDYYTPPVPSSCILFNSSGHNEKPSTPALYATRGEASFSYRQPRLIGHITSSSHYLYTEGNLTGFSTSPSKSKNPSICSSSLKPSNITSPPVACSATTISRAAVPLYTQSIPHLPTSSGLS